MGGKNHYHCIDCHKDVFTGFDYIRAQRVDSRVAASTESMLTNQGLPALVALDRLKRQIHQQASLVLDYYSILRIHNLRRKMSPSMAAIDRVIKLVAGIDPEEYFELKLRGKEAKEKYLIEGQEMVRKWLEEKTIEEQGGGSWNMLLEVEQLIPVAEYQAAKGKVANYEWVENRASRWTGGPLSRDNLMGQRAFRQRVARE